MEFFGKEQWQQWHGTKTAPYTGPGSLLIPLESDPSLLEPVGFALWGTQQEMRSMHCTWKWRVSPKILLLAPPSQSRHSKGCTIDLLGTPQTLHSDLWGNSKNVNLKNRKKKRKIIILLQWGTFLPLCVILECTYKTLASQTDNTRKQSRLAS